MKGIIHRYLGANFVVPFIVSACASIGFLLIFQFLAITKLIVNKNVKISLLGEMVLYMVMSFLPLAVPLAVLFASIYSLNRLSSDSELLAMRSFGHSLLKMFMPFLTIGILIAVALYSLHMKVIPAAEVKLKVIMASLATKGVLTDIKPAQFFTDIPNITIYAEKVANEGKLLTNVFMNIKEDSEKERAKEKIIMAKQGMLYDVSPNAYSGNFKLKLIEGNIIQVEKDNKVKGDTEKILFKEYLYPLPKTQLIKGFTAKDSMRSTRELMEVIKGFYSGGNKFFTLEKDIEIIRSELELYLRVNNSLLCFIFTLLGFSLGIQRGRGKNQNSVSVSLIVLVLYYAILFTGISMAKSGKLQPVISVFLPSLITFTLSCFLARRLRWIV
ncbi:MAG: LptF/LptG family permease [Oligoflexia bacterium]|nr:LptF/LptG family permease [Oligoflexia bacterium]